MNDWLDYKGSGSSRAYMGDTISHGLFGIQTKKDKAAADAKQLEADKRYNAATAEKFNKLQDIADKAKAEYEDSIAQYNHWVRELEAKSNELRSLESDRKRVSAKSPLTAAQMYEPRIKRAKDDKEHAKDCVQTWRDKMDEFKAAWRKAQDDADNYWRKEAIDSGRTNAAIVNARLSR